MSASDARGLLLAVVLALSAFSCSDDAGDDGGPSVFCLQFTPLAAPASGTVATVEGAGSTCDESNLDLVISDVTDVFGFSFTATFDPAVVSFSGISTTGTLLVSDGNMPIVEVTESPGAVAIGVTRVGSTGVDAVGPQRLVTLRFLATGSIGLSTLELSSEKMLGSETPPMEKPGISWSGGVFELL